MRRLIPAVLLAIAASVALVGCSTSGPAVLNEEQVAEDMLPPDPGEIYQGIDRESTRFLGNREDISFYLARSTEEMAPARSVCLIAVSRDDRQAGMASCGGVNPVRLEGGTPRFTMKFVADGSDPELEEGEERVHENLIVRMKG